MIIELRIVGTGQVTCHDVYPGVLQNHAKLAYPSTGAWLEGRGPMPPAIARAPGMEAQLRLQLEVSEMLRSIRKQHGTLVFGKVEATPVVENGEVKDLTILRHNVAEDIIESFMVAANVAMAQYLKEAASPAIRRVVKTPERWDRIRGHRLAVRGETLPSAPRFPRPGGFPGPAQRLPIPRIFPEASRFR